MCSFLKELGQINFDCKENSPKEFYNYAALIGILQLRCHYIILHALF